MVETQHKKGSKTQRVLDMLKTYGVVSNRELNKICFRYSAVIHELRKEGHIIVTTQVNNEGLFMFSYKGVKEDD